MAQNYPAFQLALYLGCAFFFFFLTFILSLFPHPHFLFFVCGQKKHITSHYHQDIELLNQSINVTSFLFEAFFFELLDLLF